MKRAVVIGLGDISGIHIHAIEQNPLITLAAVCDIDETAAGHAPEGIPFYTDYEEMIRKEHPDVVHICLPHYLHVPVAIRCAELGCHVFCEKPVALHTAQAEEFAAFEAQHPQVHIGICLQNRMNRTVATLKELLDSGEYGQVTGTKGLVPWARPKSYYDVKPWRGKWETAGGGCMINQAVHTLDLLYYLGGPVESLKSSVSQILDYGIEVEDTVSANLSYENGAHGLFLATIANYQNENVQISVQTEKAEFSITDNSLYRRNPDGTAEKITEDLRLPGAKFYYGASHQAMIGRFYNALENDNDDYLHVRDAVMSIRLIDAIHESSRAGKRVLVSAR